MEWYQRNIKVITLIALSFLLLFLHQSQASKSQCGFPGTPASGYVKPNASLYSEGDIVSYNCRAGYILIGSSIRRCRIDGSWSEEIPICDESMTTLGHATSTPTVPGHPAELAIDRNKDTCTSLVPKKNRWWRIDLGNSHKILSVAVTMASTDTFTSFTVYVVSIPVQEQEFNALYKRCASFTGKFGTPTIVLNCIEGRGIEGQRVHIEDDLKNEDYFEVCEVEVQVKKVSGYTCGMPNRNPYSIIFDIEDDEVEYGCQRGYHLQGRSVRECKNNGQWSGVAPICEAIICEPLPVLEKGQFQLSVMDGDTPLEGTVVNYNCDRGYKLIGNYNRECRKDGSWSGKHPKCEAVRCIVPDGTNANGHYHLVNGSTKMGSVAYLRCVKGKRIGENPYISCNEEGNWTLSQSRCMLPWKVSAIPVSNASPRIAKKEAIIFGMVVAGMMMTVVLVSLYIVTQRRRRARKPELPCRQMTAPEAPPRPPPRTKGALASTLLQCVSGDSDRLSDYEADEKENETLLKTRSLPSKNSWKPEVALNKASSLDKPPQEDKNEERDKTRSISPKSEPESEEVEESSENEASPEIQDEESTKEEKENEGAAARDYAAIDYEKKRQSRLMKDQSSEDNEGSRKGTPTTPDDDENSSPPLVPPKGGLGDAKAGSISPEPVKQSPKILEKSGANSTTGRTRRTRATEDTNEDQTIGRNPRRTRARDEVADEPEEKPTFREGRRTRLRE